MADLKLPRINRTMLAGRVVRDFALRYTTDRIPVATFTVAFNRSVKNDDGTWKETAGFVNVLVSHRLAEQCAERLKKGSPVYLEGRLQMRRIEGEDGRTRPSLEIKADAVQFLDRRDEPGADDAAKPVRPVEGDLPF